MPEVLVSVRKFSNKIKELNVVKRVATDYPLLVREEVARRLAKVAEKLPEGLYLQADSGYRTRKTQEALWSFRHHQMGNEAGNLVYNPSLGLPPHCTGGAVDVSLTDCKGREVNLSEPFIKFYNEPQLISIKITKEAQELRLLLNKLMTEEGFVAHPSEYWHFSYGDQCWADTNKVDPLYYEVELTKISYFSTPKRLYFKALRKVWKFANHLLGIQTNY